MSVLTMKMPAELAAKLEKVAARRKVSKSQIVREAVEAALAAADVDHELSAHDLMKEAYGMVRSGKKDLGSNKKHLTGYGR